MVEYRNLFVRSSRRIRLEFSSALAAGAFVTSWYSLVCEDSSTADPGVVAALAVPSFDRYVELAVDRDLAEDGQYTLTVAAGVPALDASTAPGASQFFLVPTSQRAPSDTYTANDISNIIFREDLAHDPDQGMIEGPDGDLASVTGPPNVRANAVRGLMSKGLPHRIWGADLRSSVDAPSPLVASLRGKAERQLRRDDRITSCRAEPAELGDGEVVLRAQLDLIGQIKTNIERPLRARS